VSRNGATYETKRTLPNIKYYRSANHTTRNHSPVEAAEQLVPEGEGVSKQGRIRFISKRNSTKANCLSPGTMKNSS
jgi:hypothetical protein